MFLLVSVRHVGAHPAERQHGVSIQISISLGKHFFGYLVYEIFLSLESWRGSLYMYLLSFPRFWTLSIERFDFYFDLFWMAWHWKPAIPGIATHDSVLFLPRLLSTHVFNLFPSTSLQEISGVEKALVSAIWKDMPVLPSAGALSIQQKFWFENSKIPRAQWNGSFRFHRSGPSHSVFAYCSGVGSWHQWWHSHRSIFI